jgi:hypothetical protein
MSKALMKKLVKQAEINVKKLSQGESVAAQAARATSQPTADSMTTASGSNALAHRRPLPPSCRQKR